jgi:outer membrane protein assembly factor BamB
LARLVDVASINRFGVFLALGALLAGCASASQHAAPTTPRRLLQHQPTRHAKVRPHPRPQPHRPARLVITVVNGDTDARVRGARVELWRRHDVTDRHGVAEIRVPWRRPLHVSVRARGFSNRIVYEEFQKYRRVTVRIYRPELQWPLFGASAARTQAQTHIALRPPFRTAWSTAMGGLLEFPAVVWNGKAYIGNATATIRAVSMQSGAVIWRHDTPNGKMASSPAVVGNTLVYHGMNGAVYVLDRANGRLLWHRWIGSPIESSPVVSRGVDYFGTWDGRVYALDLRTRALRWTRSLGSKITSSAAIVGGRLFIGDYAGHIWALDPLHGGTRWVQSVNGRVYGTPAVLDGRVFVPSSTGGSMTAFSTGGRYLWRVSTGSYVYSSPAVWGGRVFFGSYNGLFYGVSAQSGRIAWTIGTGGPISGAAVVVDGVAYAGSFSHQIFGVDTRSGRVLMRFPHGHYVPVSGNGGRLLFHGYGALYGVEPVPRAAPQKPSWRSHPPPLN